MGEQAGDLHHNCSRNLNIKDELTLEVKEILRLLKALEESLHEDMTMTLLGFLPHLMAIKLFFSNNCYNELIKLFEDVLLMSHKYPKDMFQSKKLLKGLSTNY